MLNDKHYDRKIQILSLALLFLLLPLTAAVKWIGMYKEKSILSNNTLICKHIRDDYSLSRQQSKLCKKYTSSMPYVQEAARLSVHSCQGLFRHKRWNCSSVVHLPKLLPDLASGTKERAFVNAISSAALTYAVARGCAASTISGCGCSSHPQDPPNGNFKWGGCGDNVVWGCRFSRQFAERRAATASRSGHMIRSSPHTYYKYKNAKGNQIDDGDGDKDVDDNSIDLWNRIKHHNGEVGRRIVTNSLISHCKCHGVSGSCSVKTCWKGLPLKFNEIGEKLMSSYNSAVQVHPHTTEEQLTNRFGAVNSLLYAAKSSSYCEYDAKLGSFGTKGRECNPSANVQDNCDKMCCGRGYKSHVFEQAEKCNCQYHWCCYVTCDTCHTTRHVSICN